MKRIAWLPLATLLLACPERYDPKTDPLLNPPSRVIPNTTAVPGVQCETNAGLMRRIIMADGTTFCIDVFEASLNGGSLGNAQQATLDTDDATDGSTTAAATVGLQEQPAAGVSFYQAEAACENAGKRLCTQAEWERACRGPQSLIYPYGDAVDEKACNGFFFYAESNPLRTGSLDSCGSDFGVFDMSGNLSEWTSTHAERVPGSGVLNDRAVRGGSFNGNNVALRCVGEEYRDAPFSAPADRGFRCCF
jgi:formylglycine-generating enzyme required for sulfatase activity